MMHFYLHHYRNKNPTQVDYVTSHQPKTYH